MLRDARRQADDRSSVKGGAVLGGVSIPLVDLQAQYGTIEGEVSAAIERVVSRQIFVNGPETEMFEAEFAAVCESLDCVAVSSGTTALELVLQALGVGVGDEVITVSHTFIATVGAIVRTGATPVLVDVDEDTWTMAPDLVAEALSPRTKAIIPVHIYGHPADVPAIAAAAPSVPIIEDAAQAHLARYHGAAVGSAAAAACYSFYPGKNLGAYGDSGAVVTNDLGLAAAIRSLRDHGRIPGAEYGHDRFGTNARAAELQSAVLRAKLPFLRGWTEERRRLAERYEDALVRWGLQVQAVQPWAEHARHLFVLLHPERDRILNALQDQGIGASSHYPVPVHRQTAMTGSWRTTESGLWTTNYVASSCLSLPLYPELGDLGVERVLDGLAAALPVAVG
jgi:dTDP-4-amino-4,6-dideoxygalactose transaminase